MPSRSLRATDRPAGSRRRRAVRTLLLGLLALPVAAAGFRHYGGEATVAVVEVPRSADPVRASSALEQMLSRLVHAPLFEASEGAVRPGLITDDFEAPDDGRRYVLTLDKRARFADGERMTAPDVARSLQRLARSESGWLLSALKGQDVESTSDAMPGVRVLDDRRLVLATGETFHGLTHLLAAPQTAIVRADEKPDDFWGPMGAGPFRPAPTRGGEVAAVSPNEHALAGRAFLDRLGFERAPDTDAAEGWLRRGRAQAAVGRGREGGADAATIVLLLGSSLSADERTRVAGAINRELLARVFLQGRAEVARGLFPTGFDTPRRPSPPDAGAPRPDVGETATRRVLWVPDTPLGTAAAERLAVDLLAAGILVERRTASPAAIARRAARQSYDLVLVEWRPVTADPALAMWEWSVRPALRRAADEHHDDLAALPGLADPDARLEAALRAEQALLESGRILPLVHPRRSLRTPARLRDLRATPFTGANWADAWLEPEP